MRLNAGRLFTRPYSALGKKPCTPWKVDAVRSRVITNGHYQVILLTYDQVPSESRQDLEASSGKARDYLTILRNELGVTDIG